MSRTFSLFLSIVFFFSAAVAMAQYPNGNGPGNGGPGGPGNDGPAKCQPLGPAKHQLLRALHRLDLGDEQWDAIGVILADLEAGLEPVKAEQMEIKDQLKALVREATYDEDAVNELAIISGELTTERITLTSAAMFEIFGHLTVEQLELLDEMAARRDERREECRDEARRKRAGED